MKINFKKLHPSAKTPAKAHPSDVGLDLVAISKYVDEFGNLVCDTGISIELPENYMGLIFARSSISKKTLDLANAVGVIDPDYRGSIMLKFKPTPYFDTANGSEQFDYEVGDKIGQLVILPFPTIELLLVEELSVTDRAEGGFGSTGS